MKEIENNITQITGEKVEISETDVYDRYRYISGIAEGSKELRREKEIPHES